VKRQAGLSPFSTFSPPLFFIRVIRGFSTRFLCERFLCWRQDPMKLIIAIVQPAKLDDVKAALNEVEVVRLTVMDVQGFGRQKGQTEVYRGHEFTVSLLRKVQLQIAVNEEFVEPTISAIIKGGRTGEKGQIGDGKIFVLPLDDCIRIRTGERGEEAI
jgi:nitrogen regulatory protein P-II 2